MNQTNQAVSLKDYKDLIETVSKIEYQKLSASHFIEYLEIVNIATHTLYILFKNNSPENYNKSYLTTAIKWAIRNEIRRRYKWYTLRQRQQQGMESIQELREAVYKTILSIDELSEAENPTQVRDDRQTPEESVEFLELKREIVDAIKKLPQRERDLIEAKFFQDKKLKDLAIEFNISPSRISRIIQSGLNKVRNELTKQDAV